MATEFDFDAAAAEAATTTEFQAGAGGPSVPQGNYVVRFGEIKAEKTINGHPQVHIRATIVEVLDFDLQGEDGSGPKVGDEFTIKLNIATETDGQKKAAESNIKQMFAVAIWNGLNPAQFNKNKLKANFAATYAYEMADANEGNGAVCKVFRQRGKPAQKGFYWNHYFSKLDSAVKAPATPVPSEADEESLV